MKNAQKAMINLKNAAFYVFFATFIIMPEMPASAQFAPVEIKQETDYKILALMVNFSNDRRTPYTRQQVEDMMFNNNNSVRNILYENSYNELYAVGEVLDWIPLPNTSRSYCSHTYDIGPVFMSALQYVENNTNVPLDNFDGISLSIPSTLNGGCLFVGGTNMRVSYTMQNGQVVTFDGSFYAGDNPPPAPTVVHEFIHQGYQGGTQGTGFGHDGALECGTSSIVTPSSQCNSLIYGNPFSLMGQPYDGNASVLAKRKLGWIKDDQIETITQPGVYTFNITPLQTAGGLKTVRIYRGLGRYQRPLWYYLENRQAIGTDAGLPPYIANGILVYEGEENFGGDITQSYLLDMTPTTSTSYVDFYRDASLNVNQTYIDPNNGITITLLSFNGLNAKVQIVIP